ncbi:MAG: 16S rRNA (cytosine(1402)-N(4))-methyltransferase RsmH [Christensenellaceae bacterium]|jgi:16S rRNA (cytosine1402-N4)-methyltransferase|nr:16S rRNA (cytosine(1402)-N(4))-methyltransferase RsmH [Christensenellaceae bacterium]
MSCFSHTPVMPKECMEQLGIAKRPQGVFVDGTLGGGGHSELILSGTKGLLIGIDRDEEALAAAKERLSLFGGRFCAQYGNFAQMDELLGAIGIKEVDGVLLDLGVSSHQLDVAERGFSFHQDAPLDMRMDKSQTKTAQDVLNTYSLENLTRVLSEYGEERWAFRIAKFIIERRPLRSTLDLVAAIDAAVPKAVRREVSHPARRSFQALRIETNDELRSLERGLKAAVSILKPGGRLAVISFHSLEDRIVKRSFQTMQNPCVCPKGAPVCVCGRKPMGFVVTRKPILPGEKELEQNQRAHSAKLRAFERAGGEGGEARWQIQRFGAETTR